MTTEQRSPVAWMGDRAFITDAVKQTSRPNFAARYPTPLYLRPQAHPDTADTARLDWIARQNLAELSMHLVIDAEHDGEYYVCGDSNKPHYGVTLRAAIDAAMETE